MLDQRIRPIIEELLRANPDNGGIAYLNPGQAALRLVGGMRLRQVRARNDSCLPQMRALGPRFSTPDGTCYGDLSTLDHEDRAPFVGVTSGKTYPYVSGLPYLYGYYGWSPYPIYGSYGRGGLIAFVDAEAGRSAALAMVAQLEADGWFSQGTRVVCLDVNLYDTAQRTMTVAQYVMEFFPSGYGLTTSRIFTFDFGSLDALNGLIDKLRG
jgi:hypothetical protein